MNLEIIDFQKGLDDEFLFVEMCLLDPRSEIFKELKLFYIDSHLLGSGWVVDVDCFSNYVSFFQRKGYTINLQDFSKARDIRREFLKLLKRAENLGYRQEIITPLTGCSCCKSINHNNYFQYVKNSISKIKEFIRNAELDENIIKEFNLLSVDTENLCDLFSSVSI